MDDNSWIKLHRRMLKWEWMDSPLTLALWINLLLEANHLPRRWHGMVIQPGQIVTSSVALAKKTGMSRQEVRTCLERLKSTNEITSESTNRFTVLTIVKWEEYQSREVAATSRITNSSTSKQPANNQQATSKQPHLKKERRKEGKKDTILLGAREKFSEFDESNDAPASEEHSEVSEVTGAAPYTGGSPHTQPTPIAATAATFKRVQAWVEQRIPACGVNCWTLAPINQWIESGADPDLDIYPTIERLCRQTEATGGRVRGLAYFTAAIADAYRIRTTPVPYNPETEGNHHANTARIYRNKPGKPSWSDALDDVLNKYGTH